MTLQETTGIQHLLPTGWPVPDAVLTQCHRTLRASLDAAGPEPVCWDLEHVRAMSFWGTASYMKVRDEVTTRDDGSLQVDVHEAKEAQLPQGRYLLLITPFDDEPLARARLREMLGLLYAYHGRNIAYERVYEQVIKLKEPGVVVFGESTENPLHLRVPALKAGDHKDLRVAIAAIPGLQPDLRARLELSLRWFEGAARDSGPDALLRYWVAIEALAMPKTTDVRFVNQRLAAGYRMSLQQASAEFEAGRLQGLRSDLVHGTRIVTVRGELLSYLAALYCDLLFIELGLPCPERAREYLAEHGEIVLRELRAKRSPGWITTQ